MKSESLDDNLGMMTGEPPVLRVTFAQPAPPLWSGASADPYPTFPKLQVPVPL